MAGELILIVEDNEKNRKLERDILQFAGERVVPERLDFRERFPASFGQPQLFIGIQFESNRLGRHTRKIHEHHLKSMFCHQGGSSS